MENKEKMLIGWSEVSITPDKPIKLMGQFVERVSQYVETPITATAMAIEYDSDLIVICSCDIASISDGLMKEIRDRIAAKGFPAPEKIIVNATHSHTSIQYKEGLDTLNFASEYLSRYLEYRPFVSPETGDILDEEEALYFLADRISEAILTAWERRVPSEISFAFGRAAVSMCRRVTYSDGRAEMWGDSNRENFVALEGGNDSGIELMYIHDEGGRLTGIAANVACPAQVLEHRLFVSADYWGKVKKRVRAALGEDVCLLSLCSPAGDLCPRDLIRWVNPETPVNDPNIASRKKVYRRADPSMFDISGAETVGRRIADEIIGVYRSGKTEKPAPALRHIAKKLTLPVRRVTKEEYEKAGKEIKEAAERAKAEKGYFDYNDNAELYLSIGTLARYESQDKAPDFEAEVHTARICDTTLSTSPFELFLDYANIIRARNPGAQAFLIQLACGSLGYIPTEKAEKGGHYSAHVTSGTTGHEGGRILVETALADMNTLFED